MKLNDVLPERQKVWRYVHSFRHRTGIRQTDSSPSSILTAISRWTWVSRCLLKQWMMEVVVTTGLLEL